ATGRLNDDRVFFENAALFGILDHRHANAVLDAAEGIEEFALEKNRGIEASGYFVEFDERGASNRLDDVIVYPCHKEILLPKMTDLKSEQMFDNFGQMQAG